MNVAAMIYAAVRAAEYPNTNPEWVAAHRERVAYAIENWLPSGSGFDSKPEYLGAALELLQLSVPYHHMDENGFYDGWETYGVTVKPSFTGLDITITGGRHIDRDYIAETYLHALAAVPADTSAFYAIKP